MGQKTSGCRWSADRRQPQTEKAKNVSLSLRRNDLECRQAVELVTSYLEGALSRRDRRRFEAHLRACPNCALYLEQIRQTIELSGSVEPEDLSPDAQDDLRRLYRRWRRD